MNCQSSAGVQASSTAFSPLRQHYTDRLAAARQANEQGVVGRVGNTVPAELILACGLLPILVAADTGLPTPTADHYMEPVIQTETRSLFELAVSGNYAAFQLLVLSRPYTQLYYYLKEVYRQGRAPQLPPLHMYDLMQSQREAVRAYNWSRTREFGEQLARASRTELTDARLRAAIALTNRVRALQRELLHRRWNATISGVDALVALGAGYFMPPQLYAATLAEYVADLAPIPALMDRPKLLVLPSEPLSHTHLHQALEDAGGLVVAEDDWWGSRAPGADILPTGSPIEGIFLKYWTDTATQNVYPADAREAWFMAHAVRSDVDCVVFYLPPSDHQLGWDYPRLRAWLEERGKPSLLVRRDAASPEGRDAVSEQVRAWLGARR